VEYPKRDGLALERKAPALSFGDQAAGASHCMIASDCSARRQSI
jgi:hypothetical protein